MNDGAHGDSQGAGFNSADRIFNCSLCGGTLALSGQRTDARATVDDDRQGIEKSLSGPSLIMFAA